MKAKNIIRESSTDWNRLKKMPDTEIDDSDVPVLDKAFFKQATLRIPKPKKSISLRVDPDVLDWFKHQGEGYQTRMNAVLKAYYEAHHQTFS